MITKKAQISEAATSIARNLPGIVYRLFLREDNRMEFFNNMVHEMTGYQVGELGKGKITTIDSIIVPEDLPGVLEEIQNAIFSGKPYQIEYRITTKGGAERFFFERGSPVEGADGNPKFIDGVIFDVTDQKALSASRRVLEETWKKYDFIINTTREFQTLIARDFRYEAVNEAYCRAHSKKREEILGKTVSDIWGEKTFAQIKPFFEQCFTGQEVKYNLSFEFPSLGRRYFDVTYYPYFNPDKIVSHVVVVSRDVTDRKKAEVERDRLEIAIRQAGEGVIITDLNGIIQYSNPAFCKISGFELPEVLGKNASFLKSGQHDSRFFENLWKTINNGEIWTGIITNRKKDGSIFQVHTVISPVRDDLGNPIHYVGVERDVTKEQIFENRSRHSQKMEAIGTLAGGIAHDFNNILNTIGGFAELIETNASATDDILKDIGMVREATSHAQGLVRQLMTFGRKGDSSRKPLRLHTIIEDSVKLLRGLFPSSVKIETRFEKSPMTILADPIQIQQVIMNLCTNALHAMIGNHGKLTIMLKNLNIKEEQQVTVSKLRAGPYACLFVIDNGQGMDKQTQDRIFDPYFTTKAIGKGTGLGLSVVHGIVTEHDGAINVESNPGKGTTIQVYFPCIEAGEAAEKLVSKVLLKGEGRILYVDDEKAIVEFTRRALTNLGYKVTGVSSSQEALSIFQKEPSAFDLVISDMTMPGMTGLEFSRKIREIHSNIPIILASGYGSEEITSEKMRAIGVNIRLNKPFSIKELGTSIRKVLCIDLDQEPPKTVG